MSEAGRNIKDVRKRRGLSQSELSKASGVSVSIIKKLEQGERKSARLETLRKLAVALRVPTMRLSDGPSEEGRQSVRKNAGSPYGSRSRTRQPRRSWMMSVRLRQACAARLMRVSR
ncbi:helix-turn-helix transcriptional regulator [Streptomyces sp. M19]